VANALGGADDGYVLLAVLVLVFLMLLTLSIAAPRVAMQLKHDQELETMHRANQYVRAIRLFHKKTGNYPTSIEQLEKTNNQRFLRQRYLDPLTGKDDWKLIQVGQNKTTVKGFFGKDLPGMGTGLGAASGMQSNMGGSSSSGSSSSSSFGSSSFGGGSSFGSSGGAGSTFGSSPPQATGGSFGGSGSGTGTPGSGMGSGNSNGGIPETDATDAKGSTGPIMGVGVPKDGEAFLSVNGVSTYQDWEFIYDPRIEQLYARNGSSGGGGGGTLGTAPPSTGINGLGQPNNPNGQAGGGNPTGPGGGNPGGGNGTPTNPPTGTSPQ
jgi:type II secretory pathway pseudopilin PulG